MTEGEPTLTYQTAERDGFPLVWGSGCAPLLQPAWPSRLPLAPAAPAAGRPVKTLGASAPPLTRRASREAARGRWRTPAPIERVIVRGTELKVTYDVTGRRCILGSSIMGVEGFFLLPFLAGGVQGCGLNKGCYPRTYTHTHTHTHTAGSLPGVRTGVPGVLRSVRALHTHEHTPSS